MACSRIYYWTITSLISSSLKIALACILLWVAFISLLAAKFLRFFGLHLPCSCNGLDEQSSGAEDVCVQGVLAGYPNKLISFAMSSVLSNFPFEYSCSARCAGLSRGKEAVLPGHDSVPSTHSSMVPKLHGRESCLRDLDKPEECTSLTPLNGGYDVDPQDKQTITSEVRNKCNVDISKENKLCRQQGRCCLHRSCALPRQGNNFLQPSEQGKQAKSSISGAFPPKCHSRQNGPGEEVEASRDNVLAPKIAESSNESLIDQQSERTLSSVELEGLMMILGTDFMQYSDIIAALEKVSLSENEDMLLSVNAELEKERNAAATAADEAMSMISRLQEEKAYIEMELRQFKREAEEKLVHDEEEIEILKEIIVRREKEHFHLEDEVQLYRARLLTDRDTEQEAADSMYDNRWSLEGFDPNALTLQDYNDTECKVSGSITNLMSSESTRVGRDDLDIHVDSRNKNIKTVNCLGNRDFVKGTTLPGTGGSVAEISSCQKSPGKGHADEINGFWEEDCRLAPCSLDGSIAFRTVSQRDDCKAF
eukprot:TRINITY_DN3740_c0_g1_i4.p1 TRINITY_DN3740_c0_g1~~TRINITY_DN3740_c0_g1_i4.p1  ORF type:complete len:537 (+),score=101.50 TRINITY_DN3740_c0_g1_i4:121-1731(+)